MSPKLGVCLAIGLLGVALGCSSGKPTVKPDSEVAQRKLDRIKKVADELAKNPDSAEAFVAFDEFNNLHYDPKAFPEVSQEIIDVYDTRIKGKYRGEFAQQIQFSLESFRKQFSG